MHVPAFYASSVQLRTRLDTRYIRILSHELALTKACGTTLRHQRHQTCAECSNTHVGVLKQTTKELSIVANRPPINISAECSTTPKWRSVIVQSADMHVSAFYASSVQLGTRLDTRYIRIYIAWTYSHQGMRYNTTAPTHPDMRRV